MIMNEKQYYIDKKNKFEKVNSNREKQLDKKK